MMKVCDMKESLSALAVILLTGLLLASAPAYQASAQCVSGPDSVALMPGDTMCSDSACAGTVNCSVAKASANPYKFKPVQLIVPATLIGVGVIGLESDWLKYQNREIREELQENIDHKLTVDDITQYVPTVAVYGLDLFGVRGKHDAVDQTIILGTAYALMGISVCSIKTMTKVERPDGSSRNSFPSGHTATAFVGAELLRREYWDVSPWIGVAGYAVATGTGFFRMYNNRHWLTDVIAGAGIGILSVEAAYWLYPAVTKAFFPKRRLKNVYLSPYGSTQEKGLTCRIVF